MRLNIVGKRAAPLPPVKGHLTCIGIELIPHILGAFWLRSQKYWWAEPEDQKLGRRYFAEMSAMLIEGCGDEIVAAVDRLYRLTDSIHNGVVYSVTGEGTVVSPYVYSPAMPLVPTTAPGAEPSVKFSLEKSLRLLDNLTNGTTYADAPDVRNFRQQLQDLITAVGGTGELDDEMLAQLINIVAALG